MIFLELPCLFFIYFHSRFFAIHGKLTRNQK